jgi:hemerythrin superfamily protein
MRLKPPSERVRQCESGPQSEEFDMPDATEILIRDHREVEGLFEQYEQSKDPAVADKICTELTVHSAVEEKVVYPVLRRDVQGGEQMSSHSEEEHQKVKDLILEVERTGPSSPEAAQLMGQMKQAVMEHVQEEEQEVFPKMRQDMGEDRLNRLGEEVAGTKEKLMSKAETAGPMIDLTKGELLELAKEREIQGRSGMSKEELISALRQG